MLIKTIEKLQCLCREQTGIVNEFNHAEAKYFFTFSFSQNGTGIEGKVYLTWKIMDGLNKGKEGFCENGTFKINEKGIVSGFTPIVLLSKKKPKTLIDFVNSVSGWFNDLTPKKKILHGDVFLNGEKCKLAYTLIKKDDIVVIKTNKIVVFDGTVDLTKLKG
jgi:hypothetical protein